jgi:soluble lytic murein transglycosylase
VIAFASFLVALILPAMQAPAAAVAVPGPPDSVVGAAAQALARGLPWRATRLLDPVLRDSARRTPDAVFLAAGAASRWGGWDDVDRLLAGEPWIDALFGGQGRVLLARAAVERGRDSVALAHARLALDRVTDGDARALALVTLARALERVGARDSAAATYLRGAQLLPSVADWLRLRAAQVTADSAGRWSTYAAITNPAARMRIPFAEAALRERLGDYLGAAKAYEALADRATALKMQLAAQSAPEQRDSVRRQLVDLVRSGSVAEARNAIAVLDSAFGRLEPADELTLARASVTAGLPARAASGFATAFDAGLGTPKDRFDYAGTLSRLGKYKESAAAFARVPAGDKLGGAAAYQRARALLRDGQEDVATKALRKVAARFPKDTAAAPPALLLLADLATDARKDGDARQLLTRLASRFPRHRFTPVARFRAAFISLLQRSPKTAAKELDALAASRLAGDEVLPAIYWAGRAWEQLGDTARARTRWRSLIEREPTSYYAGLAERRLGLAPWAPPAAADSFVAFGAVDSGVARAALLERLGLAREAGWEYDLLARDADQSIERLLATADAFRTRGLGAQAIRLARRALVRGAAPDARLYRLLYPVLHADALAAEAESQGLDPSFVAALVRQESMFNPQATSAVGARGLMQVMPDLGRTLARTLEFPEWDPVLLWQPDVSLELGTVHLADLMKRLPDPVRVLAAYNAGVSRVARWQGKAGMDDPEIFAERIPFIETRDYVRIIQRNQDIYRALYAWDTGAPRAMR